MKKYLYLLLPLLAMACSTTSTNNSYYGYDNNPSVRDDDDFEDANWSNPMATNNNTSNVDRNNNIDNSQYSGPVYVPVIVPWWNSYHGWGSDYRRRRGVYVHYSNYWGPEWYSPWYSYHPYHGVTWYDYWYVRPHYRHWHSQPVYSYSDRPIRRTQGRTYGSSRGTYSVYNPRGTNSSSRSSNRTYNPRSERYTSSGTNIYRRGEENNSRSTNVRRTSGSSRSNSYSTPSNSSRSRSTTNSSGSSRGNTNTRQTPSKSSGPSVQPSNSGNSKSSGTRSSGSSRGGSSRSSGSSRGK